MLFTRPRNGIRLRTILYHVNAQEIERILTFSFKSLFTIKMVLKHYSRQRHGETNLFDCQSPSFHWNRASWVLYTTGRTKKIPTIPQKSRSDGTKYWFLGKWTVQRWVQWNLVRCNARCDAICSVGGMRMGGKWMKNWMLLIQWLRFDHRSKWSLIRDFCCSVSGLTLFSFSYQPDFRGNVSVDHTSIAWHCWWHKLWIKGWWIVIVCRFNLAATPYYHISKNGVHSL